VRLRGVNGSTTIEVDGDVTLAGALGAVGQKVVARQAGRVTLEFADNLRRTLAGELPASVAGQAFAGASVAAGQQATGPTGPTPELPAPGNQPGAATQDAWIKAGAVLSGVSVILSGIALARSRRAAR
jgi:uncharacterized protein